MTDKKELVNNWLKTKSFTEGVEIMMLFNKSRGRMLKSMGPARISKLEYELKKMAGIEVITAKVTPAKTTPAASKPENIKPPAPAILKIAERIVRPAKPSASPARMPPDQFSLSAAHATIGVVPREVELVAREHSKLFLLRSRLADQRYELGKGNSPEVVKNRKTITQSIHQISMRIEDLFEAHSAYLSHRILPDVYSLKLAQQEAPEEDSKKVEDNEEPTGKPKPIDEMTEEELKSRKTTLLALNRRDRLELRYSGPRQLYRENPLPPGERRTKLEKRVLHRQDQIEQIEARINTIRKAEKKNKSK